MTNWTFARGPSGMFRVGPMQGKTFIPQVGFILATDAKTAIDKLNNPMPYVPVPPLPMPVDWNPDLKAGVGVAPVTPLSARVRPP